MHQQPRFNRPACFPSITAAQVAGGRVDRKWAEPSSPCQLQTATMYVKRDRNERRQRSHGITRFDACAVCLIGYDTTITVRWRDETLAPTSAPIALKSQKNHLLRDRRLNPSCRSVSLQCLKPTNSSPRRRETYPVSFCLTIPPSLPVCLPVLPPSTTNRSSWKNWLTTVCLCE